MVDIPQPALGAARTLALTRVVAGLFIVFSADVHGAGRFAGLDPQLVSPPPGLGWLRLFDLSAPAVTALTWLVVVAALLGALGAYARPAFVVTALGLFVLLGLSHRVGAIVHSHHLLWAACVLAATPCGDVWSIDAYFEPRALRVRAAYTAALAVLRALAACIYFFPGLHKLIAFLSGTAPDAWLRSHLAWKWLQHGAAPARLADLPSSWFAPLALGVVAFELSMPLLVAFRRTRPLALLGAVVFHVATAQLLFIRFDSLAVVLVSLLDLERSAPTPTPLRELVRAAPLALRWVGAVLVLAAVATGVTGATQLYPFACYPTFAAAAAPTMPSARVVLTPAHGAACALPRPNDSPGWIAAFRIAGAYGDPLTPARAAAYLRRELRAKRRVAGCRADADTHVALVLEQLAWDFPARRLRVVQRRVAYSAAASALGIAPASGTSASSSPPR